MSEGFAEKSVLDLLPASSGGGTGGTDNYSDLTNKPKINNVTLSGNKTSSDLSLQDKLVSGTNIKTINSTSLLDSGNIDLVGDVQVNGTSVVSSGVANIPKTATNVLGVVKMTSNSGIIANTDGAILTSPASEAQILAKSDTNRPIVPATIDYAVRSVAPACTTITASDTTATITANTTYAHAVSSSGCTYTLTTPSATDVYSGFILMIDTTNSASIAFQTDGSPSASIVLNGNPTIATGKKYTVTGQYSVINNAWELFILDYSA